LAESAAEFFPDAAWQRCVVHWYRNIFSHVPSTKVQEIAAMLKAIHAGEDIAAAREKAIRAIEKLRGLGLSRAAGLGEMAVEGEPPCTASPEEHGRRIPPNTPPDPTLLPHQTAPPPPLPSHCSQVPATGSTMAQPPPLPFSRCGHPATAT